MGQLIPKWPAITETSQMVNWRTYSQSFPPSFIKEQLTNPIYLKCTTHAQPKEGSHCLTADQGHRGRKRNGVIASDFLKSKLEG